MSSVCRNWIGGQIPFGFAGRLFGEGYADSMCHVLLFKNWMARHVSNNVTSASSAPLPLLHRYTYGSPAVSDPPLQDLRCFAETQKCASFSGGGANIKDAPQ